MDIDDGGVIVDEEEGLSFGCELYRLDNSFTTEGINCRLRSSEVYHPT